MTRETVAMPWKWLASLTVLAVILRTIGIDGGLWYDEIRTLTDSVRSPLARIVTFYPGEHQHTLYSVLAHMSIAAFGDHEWSLRLPSLLFGAATVPLVYLFSREFAEPQEGLLASLLLAVSYHHVWFSQNARGYALLAFLTLLGSWLLLRGLRRGAWTDFVGFGVVAALGVYTHVTMVFVVMTQAASCVIALGVPFADKGHRDRWRLLAAGFGVAAVVALGLYWPMLGEMRQVVESRPSPMRSATAGWALAEGIRGLQVGLGSAAMVLGAAAFLVIGAGSYLRQSRFLFALFTLPGAATIAAAIILHRPVRPRFLVFLAGFAVIMVVRGALETGRWIARRFAIARPPAAGSRITAPGIALALVVAAASAVSLRVNYQFPKQDFAGAMQFVDASRAPHEPVVVVGPAAHPYRAYFNRDWERIATPDQLHAIRGRRQGADAGGGSAGASRVWVVYTLTGSINADAPELMRVLRADCAVAGVFRGTVGGGDVTVCTTPAPSSR